VEGLELPGLWSLTPLGGMLGMLATLYWLFATGRIITRTSHEREIEIVRSSAAIAIAAEVKRGDEWKETALHERRVNVEIRGQNTILLEATRTSAHFFAAVTPTTQIPEDTQPTGGDHVVAP
jgi:hypothetical protein